VVTKWCSGVRRGKFNRALSNLETSLHRGPKHPLPDRVLRIALAACQQIRSLSMFALSDTVNNTNNNDETIRTKTKAIISDSTVKIKINLNCAEFVTKQRQALAIFDTSKQRILR
jgi:L-fucose mutarotase/ribose pyranase (RbsD/FucU family)